MCFKSSIWFIPTIQYLRADLYIRNKLTSFLTCTYPKELKVLAWLRRLQNTMSISVGLSFVVDFATVRSVFKQDRAYVAWMHLITI